MAEIEGGQKLAIALAKIAANIKKPGSLRVGFLGDKSYPNGTSIAMVAAIQNFGAPRARIPPRPFFTNMVKDKSPGWPKAIAAELKANGYDATKTMRRVGEGIQSQLQESISNTFAPPLSPVTLMLRKMQGENSALVVTGKTVGEAARRVRAGESTAGVSTKPLIWTGQLLGSTAYEVT